MTKEEIASFFHTTRLFIQGNPDLRDPQVEGWFRTYQHLLNVTAFRRTEEALGTLLQGHGIPSAPRPRGRRVERHYACSHRPGWASL